MARTKKEKYDWLDAIEKVLEDEKKPVHYVEIANLVIERGYRKSVGATPPNTVSAKLGSDIKINGNESKFEKTERGTFILKKYLDTYKKQEKEEEIELLKEEEENKKAKKYTDIIQAFGIYWERSKVLWRTEPKLLGKQSNASLPVNFSNQKGVYLLYDGREIIYAGQASESLGKRLYQHTSDRLSGRWDRFSWFGFYSVDGETGKLNEYNEKDRTIAIGKIIDTLEAILIETIEPRQNRRAGNWKEKEKIDDVMSKIEYNQVQDPEFRKKERKQLLKEMQDYV